MNPEDIAKLITEDPDVFDRPTNNTISEPGYLYHATNEQNLHDIIDLGYLDVFPPDYGTDQRTWPDGSTESRSYWGENAGSVWQFAPEEGKSAIIRTKKSPQFHRENTGDWYARERIPARQLEVLSNGKWMSLTNPESNL